MDEHGRPADGGQYADVRRTDGRTAPEHHLTRLDVLAGLADVRANRDRHPHADVVAVGVAILDADHGVGAARDHGAGEELHGRPRFHRGGDDGTGRLDGDDPQACGRRGDVGMANGVAVHRGIRRGGYGAPGHDVLRRDTAERIEDGHPLGAEGMRRLEHAGQRLADGNHRAER